MNFQSKKRVENYQSNYREFSLCFKNSQISAEEKIKLFDEFSKNYLVLPEMWIERLKMQPKNPMSEEAKYVNMIKNGMFDFYSESLYDFVDNDGILPVHWHGFKKIPFDRLMNGRNFERFKRRCEAFIGKEECQMLVLENLSFPHSNLKEVLDLYEELTGTFITTEVFELYQKTQKLYDKINENRDNHKKWFDCLLESKNDRFIIQNVESRISEEPTNIQMWQLYIKFLKQKNKRAAFEVFFRYKRLFLSDKTFDDDFKLWKGKIPLQRENRYLDKMKYYLSIVNGKQSLPLPAAPLYYQCRILPPQSFTFPVSLISAVIKNANPNLLQKLYQSSKYFYFKTQKPICHTLYIKLFYKSNYFGNSLSINEKSLDYEILKMIKIRYQLIIKFQLPSINKYRRLLSSVIPKLKLGKIRILKIYSQIFSSKDYEFLTKNKSIEKIVLYHVSIVKEDDGFIILEDLFRNLSNAFHIELPIYADITDNSWEQLSNFVSHTKIKYMYFPGCEKIESQTFLTFLFSNCADNSKVYYPYSTDFENMKKMVIDFSKSTSDDNPNIKLMECKEYEREKFFGAY